MADSAPSFILSHTGGLFPSNGGPSKKFRLQSLPLILFKSSFGYPLTSVQRMGVKLDILTFVEWVKHENGKKITIRQQHKGFTHLFVSVYSTFS
ncbi:hypothetical protein CDAR_613581 [Caerostris darwini]|uniref:Uncharacterized protein n=1 Tax=Caerostris darwini TaxID=1538125 RepID=A0AAV4RX52_9ARAC|nr:hypothetical protein CDAR_613581 [Caerostris darwini]